MSKLFEKTLCKYAGKCTRYRKKTYICNHDIGNAQKEICWKIESKIAKPLKLRRKIYKTKDLKKKK